MPRWRGDVQRPAFQPGDARRIARDRYGLEVAVRELPGERDRNFLLLGEDGARRVLKVSRADEDPAFLEMQGQALERLADRGGPFRFPTVLADIGGDELVEVADADGTPHLVRLLAHVPGVPLGDVRPRGDALLEELGRLLGTVTEALEGYGHPAAERSFRWDLRDAGDTVRAGLRRIDDPERRSLLERVLHRAETEIENLGDELPVAVVHGDGNDYNVLAGPVDEEARPLPRRHVVGLVDFGDMLRSWRVTDLAVGIAYAWLGADDPLGPAAAVMRGYRDVFPLNEAEVHATFPLACMRLCLSVVIAAEQMAAEPDNDYLAISQADVWATLERLDALDPARARARLRHARGMEPHPHSRELVRWLREHGEETAPVMRPDPATTRIHVFDLGVGSVEMGGGAPGEFDVEALGARLFGIMEEAGVKLGVGRYDEARCWYGGELFAAPDDDGPRRRTVHLGIDLFQPAGSPVFAPLPGRVAAVRDNAGELDYGPTLLLRHDVESIAGPIRFWTLYGHLDPELLDRMVPGRDVRPGDRVARLGAPPANGNWPPHLHFQVILDMLGREGEFPGVCAPGEREFWKGLCPDPNLILRIPEERLRRLDPETDASPAGPASSPAAAVGMSRTRILQGRRRHLGPNLSLSYRRPLHIVRGWRQHLYSADGRPYLDAVNNVPHVGHSHPRVAEAADLQSRLLNTNTRYLHELAVRYAERLTELFPEPLRVCYLVCSGSEANELALRMARAHTGRRDVVVLEGGYHGNTSTLIDLSHYKHAGPGGRGSPDWVHVAPMPDPYRGRFRGDGEETGLRYVGALAEVAGAADEHGGPAALLAEALPGCGGQIVPPRGFLAGAFEEIRRRGGVAIADEVQIGLGRVGTHMWAFQAQGATPDIVTLGKPLGNGFPLAAVVTTPEVADSFDDGMEYFNTFGGNPVACAVGLAVLEVIEEEGLREHARQVGKRLLDGLGELRSEHRIVGDVRGAGLYLGVELVRDRAGREPAAAAADYVINRLRDRGILISTDGPDHDVLKIKPPLAFDGADAERLVAELDRVLREDAIRRVTEGDPAL